MRLRDAVTGQAEAGRRSSTRPPALRDGDDVAARGPGQPAGQRRGPRPAPPAPLTPGSKIRSASPARDPGAVVEDGDHDVAVRARDVDLDARGRRGGRRSPAAGAARPRRRPRPRRRSSGSAAACTTSRRWCASAAGRTSRSTVRVTATASEEPRTASLRAAASSVSITAAIRSVPASTASSAARVARRARAVAQRQLDLAAHAAQRRAQLVRHLGGEALLVAQGGVDAAEQAVEGGGERGQLVDGRAEREAAVQVVLAPVGGLRGHVGDRAQRGADRARGRPARRRSERRRRAGRCRRSASRSVWR